MQDDTENIKEEIRKLKNELTETKRTNQKYLQNVAHQLTAPLGAIKWSIEALKDETIPVSRRGNLLRSIYSQATILVHLIKNFSLMSNLEADHELGEFREQREPVNLMKLAINLANDFQPQAFEHGIKIEVDDDSFRRIFGDKGISIIKNFVAQAISNILENAVKYADNDTKIIIKGEMIQKGEFGFSVTSTGIPISEDEKTKIFDRGFRGVKAGQKIAPGTGIGLFLANRIMKIHKGKIEVKTENRKSEFILVFPL